MVIGIFQLPTLIGLFNFHLSSLSTPSKGAGHVVAHAPARASHHLIDGRVEQIQLSKFNCANSCGSG